MADFLKCVNFEDVSGTIAALPDDKIEWFLSEALERRFGKARLGTASYEFVLTLPEGYRVLVSTNWVESEVCNGGIAQFFWNRHQDYELIVADALVGYEKLGAKEQAEALRACMSAFLQVRGAFLRLRDQPRRRSPQHLDPFQVWSDFWNDRCHGLDWPLMEYEEISTRYRIPWIRLHAQAFVFSCNQDT